MTLRTNTDDTYVYLADEFSQIQQCVGMYISRGGTDGALHLFKEIFNNALDECLNPKSNSRKIYVTYDFEADEFCVTDEGRGIPFDILMDVCTKKHFSTKFTNPNGENVAAGIVRNKGTAGLNGVGLKVTMALSDHMVVTSMRGREYKSIEYINGEIKETPILKSRHEQTGLSVRFAPSEKYLGHIEMTRYIVEDFLRKMSYILPEGITIYYEGIIDSEKKEIERKKYTYCGLSSNVKYLSPTLEFNPVDISISTEDFDMSMSFSYDLTLDETLINSYCNYIYTTEGGTHELAAQRAICDFFSREAKKLDPASKYEVIYDDCKKGLIIALNCMHVTPEFEGQHKSKVSNKDILQIGRKGLAEALADYFGMNTDLLRKIIGILRKLAKARIESSKIKGVTPKKATTFLDDGEMKRFINIADRDYTGYKELIITEGDSAAGALSNSRNAKYQAIYMLRGVPDNVYGMPLDKVAYHSTFSEIIKIMGCGIGDDFDPSKLKWDKVIICTDMDVDGFNITSYLLLFFLLQMRKLIEMGKIYKALPPLYLIDTKNIKKFYNGSAWLYDKKELYSIFNNIIVNNVNISSLSDNGEVYPLTKKEALGFLTLNSEYLLELDGLVKRTACNPFILEWVCHYCRSYSEFNPMDFKEKIEKKFVECTFDISTSSLYGSYNRENVSLIIDRIFFKMATRFLNVLNSNEIFQVVYINKNDSTDVPSIATIGQFLTKMNSSFDIKIVQRYKGLGEADPKILFATTTNPKMRKLIQVTMDDLEETLNVFELLHGKNESMREKRRKLLEEATISYADIDN